MSRLFKSMLCSLLLMSVVSVAAVSLFWIGSGVVSAMFSFYHSVLEWDKFKSIDAAFFTCVAIAAFVALTVMYYHENPFESEKTPQEDKAGAKKDDPTG